MKIISVISGLTLALWLVPVIGCQPPYKLDYDNGFGKLIYKTTCQNQAIYLMDMAHVKAYKSGYTYSDTLTIAGVRYTHVVRLDSSQSAFLATKQVNDKLMIDFEKTGKSLLPVCTNLSSTGIEMVKIISIGSTDYD